MLVDDLLPNTSNELSLNDSSIKRFVNIIKTKISELEKTIKQKTLSFPFELMVNPKTLSTKIIDKHIRKELKEVTLVNKDIEREISVLKTNPKHIKYVIEEYEFMNDFNWL
jgi:hypothetical protein